MEISMGLLCTLTIAAIRLGTMIIEDLSEDDERPWPSEHGNQR